jgi:Protein of unknown function (DUF2865)
VNVPAIKVLRMREGCENASGVTNRKRILRTAAVLAAIVSACLLAGADMARAEEGFFDFLFSGGGRWEPPWRAQDHAPPVPGVGRVAPAPLGRESVTEGGGSTGHGVAFCVRLCDGHHFPMENMAKGTPAETCRSICPYSKTKVFFGSEISTASAQDGQRYADLDTAFVYRKQLVDKCTCNGRDAMGLAPLDVRNDPTLRPGDMVATKDGIATYTGRPGASFTPVNPATLPVDIR